jgi:hypothetical protein
LLLGVASLVASVSIWVVPGVAVAVEATRHHGPAEGDMFAIPSSSKVTLAVSLWLTTITAVVVINALNRRYQRLQVSRPN